MRPASGSVVWFPLPCLTSLSPLFLPLPIPTSLSLFTVLCARVSARVWPLAVILQGPSTSFVFETSTVFGLECTMWARQANQTAQGSACLCLANTVITSVSPSLCFLFSVWLLEWNLGPPVCRTGAFPTELSFPSFCGLFLLT